MPAKKLQRINLNHFSQIGSSNFEAFATNEDAIFVDKTLLIEAILASQNVMLITRPRRWGKTLNMSMLQYFFGIPTKTDGIIDEAALEKKKHIFSKMKIGQHKKLVSEHCGKYPVIFVSLKNIRSDSIDDIKVKLKDLVQELYKTHRYLIYSNILDDVDKEEIRQYIKGDISDPMMFKSMKQLSCLLRKHFEKNVVILIDEYDTPLNDWYAKKLSDNEKATSKDNKFLEEALDIFRAIFSEAMKDNPYLEKGVITGILRIAKASLFSGLNNLGEDSILDNQYSPYFGFLEEEVMELLHKVNMDKDEKAIETIKSWYNGYNIGGLTIYNPWSIMNFLNRKEFGPYWVATASTALLENALILDKFQEEVQSLIDGGTVDTIADPKMVFNDIKTESTSLYNLLLFSGYLTSTRSQKNENGTYNCRVKIPNNEVRGIFSSFIKTWINEKCKIEEIEFNNFVKELLEGNIKEFEVKLKSYLSIAASYFSTGEKQLEIFFNGFMIGLVSSVSNSYIVESEKESGMGRIDLCIIPTDKSWDQNAIIMEFKIAKSEADLKNAAKTAFNQINEKNYGAKIQNYPNVEKIYKLGIAFFGKDAHIVWE